MRAGPDDDRGEDQPGNKPHQGGDQRDRDARGLQEGHFQGVGEGDEEPEGGDEPPEARAPAQGAEPSGIIVFAGNIHHDLASMPVDMPDTLNLSRKFGHVTRRVQIPPRFPAGSSLNGAGWSHLLNPGGGFEYSTPHIEWS